MWYSPSIGLKKFHTNVCLHWWVQPFANITSILLHLLMLIPCHLHFQFKLNLLIFSPDAKFAGSIKVQTKTQVYDPLAGFVTHVTRVSRFIYMLLCALMNRIFAFLGTSLKLCSFSTFLNKAQWAIFHFTKVIIFLSLEMLSLLGWFSYFC